MAITIFTENIETNMNMFRKSSKRYERCIFIFCLAKPQPGVAMQTWVPAVRDNEMRVHACVCVSESCVCKYFVGKNAIRCKSLEKITVVIFLTRW